MKFVKAENYEELSRMAAGIIAGQIREDASEGKRTVLGLATGSSPIGTYDELIRMNKAGELDFSTVTTVNLDEYVGLGPDHPQGYRYFMNEHLFNHVNIDMKNTFVPDGLASDLNAACRAYDENIASLGGITLQLLGIGPDGHIGFNEPCSYFTGPTHVTPLHESTVAANSRFFASANDVPKKAVTMGIAPIMAAKKIVLVANGKAKKDVLMRAVEGNIDPLLPASILQLHPDVTVIFSEN